MGCILGVGRTVLPAGSRRLVLYDGDTPLQLPVIIYCNQFSERTDLINARANRAGMV